MSLNTLDESLSGLAPDDDGFAIAHRAWNLSARHRPALVVMAENAADIQQAVRYARSADLGVGVMATGHGTGTPCDSGVLVNTSRMRDVQVNPVARAARVAAGAVWADVVTPPRTAWPVCPDPAPRSGWSATPSAVDSAGLVAATASRPSP